VRRPVGRGLGLCLALWALAGCSSGFYLSESEVAAYRANLRTAASATELLDNLRDLPVEVEFEPSAPDLRIRRSNLLDVLRAIPELWFAEQVFGQIRLERLSRQIEEEVQVWLGDRVGLVRNGSDTPAGLKRLERATVRFLAPPAVEYRAAEQRIRIDLRLALSLAATIEVRDPGGIVGALVGWAVPDGVFPITIAVNDLALGIDAHLSAPLAAAGQVRLRVVPRARQIEVRGTAPDDVKEGVRRLVAERLSPTLEASRLLRFDYFSLANLRLVPAATAAGDPELQVTYRVRPEGAEPVLDVVIRGDDNALHHARRHGGVWGAFTAVPLSQPIAADPALVASGPDRLELVAVATNGDIHHATRHASARGSEWEVSGPRGIAGLVYTPTRPVLLATAPGQLEVIAIAAGGSIRHLRRLDGRWHPEQFIDHGPAIAPLRDVAGAQAGSQLVVLYADARDRLFGSIFDLERGAWSEPFLLQDRVRHAAAIAPCTDGQLDVVYVAEPSPGRTVVHHRVLAVSPTVTGGLATMSAATEIAGPLDATPTLVCSGYRQLELLGRTGTRLVHNRFLGPFSAGAARREGWQGWEEVRDALTGTLFDGRVDAPVAAASTRTGHLHVVVRGQATPRPLFHNSRDTFRDWRTPPKAVHWRGFERVAARRFVGRPALALRQRQVEAATMGVDGRLWHGALTDADAVRLAPVNESLVYYPVEPVVLPSAPGIVDFVALRPDGRLAHHRRLTGGHDRPMALLPPPPAGSGATAPPAAVAVGGQLEVVARGADRALYHWRFRRGVWEPPARIGGDVLSAPILASTGAGRLLVLALGQDRRLYRWHFAGGQWSGWSPVPGDFPIAPLFFAPPAAVSRGDGGLDLVVVEDGTGRMFHTWLHPDTPVRPTPVTGPPNAFVELGGDAVDVPVLAAAGPDRLQLLAVFRDGRLYTSEAAPPPPAGPALTPVRPTGPLLPAGRPSLAWQDFRWLGPGPLLGSVVRLDDDELVAAAADRQGRLYVSRFAHPRGLAFAPAFGQRAETQAWPPFRPTLAAGE
jgi:hypothetical protein